MVETIDKNTSPSPPKQEEPLSQEDQDLIALQNQLSNAAEGWSIEVRRVEPYWCAGLLCTIPIIDPDRPVDFDSLIKRWGGQTLRLKLKNQKGQYKSGGTLVARSWPPKVNGKLITEDTILHPPGADPDKVPPSLNPMNALATMQQNQNPNPYGINIPELMKMAMSQKGGDGGAMAGRLLEHALAMQQQAMQAAAQAPRADMMGQIEGFMSMFKMFEQMKSLFGGEGGGGGGGGEDSMMPMLNMLMQGFGGGGGGGAPQQRPRRRRPAVTGPAGAPPPPSRLAPPPSAPPVAQFPPPGPQVAQPQQSVNAPAPAQDSNQPQSLQGLAGQLSGLSAQEAAEVALMAFGDMPESKRAEAMEHFIGADQMDDLDEVSMSADNYLDDDTGDQEQQLPGAFPPDTGRL